MGKQIFHEPPLRVVRLRLAVGRQHWRRLASDGGGAHSDSGGSLSDSGGKGAIKGGEGGGGVSSGSDDSGGSGAGATVDVTDATGAVRELSKEAKVVVG